MRSTATWMQGDLRPASERWNVGWQSITPLDLRRQDPLAFLL
jgi:hypothetical protein